MNSALGSELNVWDIELDTVHFADDAHWWKHISTEGRIIEIYHIYNGHAVLIDYTNSQLHIAVQQGGTVQNEYVMPINAQLNQIIVDILNKYIN